MSLSSLKEIERRVSSVEDFLNEVINCGGIAGIKDGDGNTLVPKGDISVGFAFPVKRRCE